MSSFEETTNSARALLTGCGQTALVAKLDAAATANNGDWPTALVAQVHKLDASYPGGLKGYCFNAVALLEASGSGANPMAGVVAAEVPVGVDLDYSSEEYSRFEGLGAAEVSKMAFVLVAGGLGERLGFSGIKLALPIDLASEETYLGTYCASILALQRRFGDESTTIPLAIMTSDDTHARTEALLEANNYFGMAKGQVILLKQEKVAALVDASAGFTLESDGQTLSTKPHGHGDVHLLLHTSGVAASWLASGKEWACFFQDTNGLVFKSMLAVMGVSKELDLDLNSMCIPRLAKQEIGAITKLVYADGSSMTANTEYNQLGPLLEALGKGGDQPDPQTGFSPFPGNINQLVVKLASYVATLDRTQGVMEEFVNPKYADATKTTFKKPTRLECMMQDYAKVLPSDSSKIGFTTSASWIGYSPAKNSISEGVAKLKAGVGAMSPSTAEADMYNVHAEMWRRRGCQVAPSASPQSYGGIPVAFGPLMSLPPSYSTGIADLSNALPSPGRVNLAEGAALLVRASCAVVFESLTLKGALLIDASKLPPNAKVVVRECAVTNKGWEIVPLAEGEEADEVLSVRGYKLVKHETSAVTLEPKADDEITYVVTTTSDGALVCT